MPRFTNEVPRRYGQRRHHRWVSFITFFIIAEFLDLFFYRYYTPTDDALESAAVNPDNKCYCPKIGDYCPPKGLQNINPCHFGMFQ